MKPLAATWYSIALVSLAACGGEAGADASTATDGGSSEDAARVDAASAIDGAITDAATGLDASTPDASDDAASDDAQAIDAATEGDGAAIDAAADAATDLDGGATEAGFVDGATMDAEAAVADARITHDVWTSVDAPTQSDVAVFDATSDGALCTATYSTVGVVSALHVTICSELDYGLLPPSGGPHYPIWADFRRYTAPVPWGYLVHAMEHGAVVVSYRCAEGEDCSADRAALASILDALPRDPLCRDDAPNRVILVPEPRLTTRVAISSWGHAYRSDCIDPIAMRAFIDEHYAHGPEDFCSPGVDRSTTGWCP